MTTPMLTPPGPWAEQALCGQADPDAWFPGKGETTAAAKRICAGCPVRAISNALNWENSRGPART
jgi:WhiB family redox-sensing transcriptional regulator